MKMRFAVVLAGIAVIGAGLWYGLGGPIGFGLAKGVPATQSSIVKAVLKDVSVDAPPVACPAVPLDEETEGPYYKAGSPERNALPGEGVRIVVTGFVLDKDCKPVPGAWLDFWQADNSGSYDNAGFNLRGHQLSDANGKYRLETVLPGEYSGRTNHIHVKVAYKQGGPVATSQIYFPGTESNAKDGIFKASQLVTLGKDKAGALVAFFNIKQAR